MILLVVLACMVMVLLAIRQLSHFESYDDAEETVHLKNEVDDDGHILSHNNIFSSLVEIDPDNDQKENYKKSNSKEPFSRKE